MNDTGILFGLHIVVAWENFQLRYFHISMGRDEMADRIGKGKFLKSKREKKKSPRGKNTLNNSESSIAIH